MCLAIADFSKCLLAERLAPHALLNNQRPIAAPRQTCFVDVRKGSMGQAASAPNVDMVIGARAVFKGCSALRVPIQCPAFRAVSRTADAKQAGSLYGPLVAQQHATLATGATGALLDFTKQTLAMMLAFCLVPSMPCHRQGLCLQTIVFATMEHTRLRRLKRATVAAVMWVSIA